MKIRDIYRKTRDIYIGFILVLKILEKIGIYIYIYIYISLVDTVVGDQEATQEDLGVGTTS